MEEGRRAGARGRQQREEGVLVLCRRRREREDGHSPPDQRARAAQAQGDAVPRSLLQAVQLPRDGVALQAERRRAAQQPRDAKRLGDRVMAGAWRYAYASVAGTSHEKNGSVCQDAGSCRVVETIGGGPVLLAMASDGAGSARRSEEGARLAVELFLDDFGAACRQRGIAAIDRAFVLAWLTRLRRRIAARAAPAGYRSGDFACTALGAVIADDRALFFQIGDGAIVISPRHGNGEQDRC